MVYGAIQKLLGQDESYFEENILIENPFRQTSRRGAFLKSVHLGLSPSKLILASPTCNVQSCMSNTISCPMMITSVYPLSTTKVDVFKRTNRQTLKVTVNDSCTKYFELETIDKRKIFWKIWCQNVNELKLDRKLWPFKHLISFKSSKSSSIIKSSKDITADMKALEKDSNLRWLDKYLYLGTKREIEDLERPVPIPGLGQTEEIKQNYFYSPCLAYWDQSEHWLESRASVTNNYCECTYTGEPTSNVTYTSLMTTWK